MTAGTETASTEQLIGSLTDGLKPVRRIASPWARAALWLLLVTVSGLVLATQVDLAAAAARVFRAPDMWLSAAGSAATALLAAIAACMVSIPGRSWRWAWLPLPAVAVWLGASGVGCLRGIYLAALQEASVYTAIHMCLPFILGTSLALSIPMALLLWWARPLRPGLVAALGGLAVASGSATLLWLYHPFDASAEDFMVHAATVLAVIGVCRAVGLLAGRRVPARR